MATETPRIVRTPETCGGKARIDGHRIRVMDIVIWYEQLGKSPDEIVATHDTLTLSEVHTALAYYYDHLDEIREDMRQDRAMAEFYRGQHSSLIETKLRQLQGETVS